MHDHLQNLDNRKGHEGIEVENTLRRHREIAYSHADEHAKNADEFDPIRDQAIEELDRRANIETRNQNPHIGDVHYVPSGAENDPCFVYKPKDGITEEQAQRILRDVAINDSQRVMALVDRAQTTLSKKKGLIESGQWFTNPNDAINKFAIIEEKEEIDLLQQELLSVPSVDEIEKRIPVPSADDVYRKINNTEQAVEITSGQFTDLLANSDMKVVDLADILKTEQGINVSWQKVSGWKKTGVPCEFCKAVLKAFDA